tara:strand:+ start:167 stop:373 length:207 start_codon:yes stop_codon:yes gene_type:complete
MSGTKRMFEMTERIDELDVKGLSEPEIVQVISDEFNMVEYLAISLVDAYFEKKIAKNFSWDGESSYGS